MTDPRDYQHLARRTANREDMTQQDRLLNYALGLGEAGEVQNLVKKAIYHRHGIGAHTDEIADELGDILWYVANMAFELGFPLEEIMERNIAKLKQRYPDGFDAQRSKDRT